MFVKSLILLELVRSTMVLDLVAINLQGELYVLSVEHTYKGGPLIAGATSEPTHWRFWHLDGTGNSFTDAAQSKLELPVSHVLGVAATQGQLLVLAEVNRVTPSVLIEHSLVGAAVPQISATKRPPQLIHLTSAQVEQVRISPEDMWSTAGLAPREWLFNPRLTLSADGSRLWSALNTADAHCLLLRGQPAQKLEPLALIPGALEPVVVEMIDRTLLLSRQPMGPWSVFFQSPRYSTASGPGSLPLSLKEIDKSGRIIRDVKPGEPKELKDAFLFAADGDGRRRLLLALIVGSRKAPRLELLRSDNAGSSFKLVQDIPLRAIPERLSLASDANQAIIGLVYKESGTYVVEAAVMPL